MSGVEASDVHMSGVEVSDGRRSPFPAEWGPPPIGDASRARWAASHIRQGQELRARGLRVQWLTAAGRQHVRLYAVLLAKRGEE